MKVPRHLQLEEIKVPPGQEWTDAAVVWHFLYLGSGAAYWLGDNRTRSLIEGELIIVAPAVKGSVRASQIGQVTLHTFNFAPDLLCGLFTLAERHFFENNTELRQSVQFLPSTHPASRQFASLINSSLKPDSLAQRIEALSLIAAVFDPDLARHHPPDSLGTTALHRFHQLIAQMPDSEIINHSPEQLARLCGCSPRHFNRLFRKHFGDSARARQTELRLLKARQLLSETEARVVQVAMDSGYRNLSLFNSLFKKRFGMTPSGWRQRSVQSNGKLNK